MAVRSASRCVVIGLSIALSHAVGCGGDVTGSRGVPTEGGASSVGGTLGHQLLAMPPAPSQLHRRPRPERRRYPYHPSGLHSREHSHGQLSILAPTPRVLFMATSDGNLRYQTLDASVA
jgi:hypothetical protein